MKHLFTFLLVGLTFLGLKAQCPAGSLDFSRQTQIDSFLTEYPNCTFFSGDISVRNSTITDLSGLQNIRFVLGDVIIDNNLGLTSLSGLTALESISGELFVINNQNLTDLTGLGALRSVGSNLTIASNQSMANLSGLNVFRSVGDDLIIRDNQNLVSLLGIAYLNTIGNSLIVENNQLLSSFASIGSITSLGGSLEVRDNIVLNDFSGLEQLNSIGQNLVIVDNGSVSDITALTDLNTVGDSIVLTGNLNLDECAIGAVCDKVAETNPRIRIQNNGTNCSSVAEVGVICQALLPVRYRDITVASIETGTLIAWETVYELNNAGFHLEHRTDAKDWETLTFVEGRGDTDGGHSYQSVHSQPTPGSHYYRIVQEDFDGSTATSEVFTVNIASDGDEVMVYPNPAISEVTVRTPYTADVLLFDQFGRLVKQQPAAQAGPTTLPVDDLPDGAYFLRQSDDPSARTTRLVIQR